MVAPRDQHRLETSDDYIDRPAIERDVSYRLLALDNGLKALLVCDSEGDSTHAKAAAAMDVRRSQPALSPIGLPNCLPCSTGELMTCCHPIQQPVPCDQVRVGSFSDPAELPGLAHFLEHMLFYASAKFPEEVRLTYALFAQRGRWLAAALL